MLARVDLVAALNSIPLARFNGTWWRAVPHHLLKGPPPGAPPGSPPQPLWPDGSALSGARYTPKGGPRTVYLASDPATVLQEVNAIFAIPNGPSIALPAAPHTMCQVNVVVNSVLDLSVPSTEAALGTSTQELTGHWRYTMETGGTPPTHLLGAAAHASGRIAAICAHSSKNVGHGFILAVFPDRLTGGSYIELIDPTRTLNQRLP
jgi:RES domain-containing protein